MTFNSPLREEPLLSGLNPPFISEQQKKHRGELSLAPSAPDVEATRKRRCVGARRQVTGVLPGPGELLPAKGGEAPEQSVPEPPAEQSDRLRVLRAGDEGAALR